MMKQEATKKQIINFHEQKLTDGASRLILPSANLAGRGRQPKAAEDPLFPPFPRVQNDHVLTAYRHRLEKYS